MLSQPQLGKALRLLRFRRNLKQNKLADLAGITKAMLSSYETGTGAPTLPSLDAVLRAMGADLRELQGALEALAPGGPEVPQSEVASPIPEESARQRILWSTSDLVAAVQRLVCDVAALTGKDGEGSDL